MEDDRTKDGLDIRSFVAETGLEARQVRYMIAEGMMPPADERGRHAAGYGPRHLDAARQFLRLQEMGFRGEGLKALMVQASREPLPLLNLPAVSVTVDPSVDPGTIDVERTLAAIGEALRFYVDPSQRKD